MAGAYSAGVTITPQGDRARCTAVSADAAVQKSSTATLEAVANGEMIAAYEPLTGAGVTASRSTASPACTLHGRAGSFLFAHRGMRNTRTDNPLLASSASRAPDRAPGQRTPGITGTIGIDIRGEEALYTIMTMNYQGSRG
jgi:hypothetical protein